MAHRTLLASCPYRKSKLIEKENSIKKETDKQINRTYAGIAKVAMEEIKPKQINITRTTDLKMTALILEAHIAALSGKKKFGELLSESMKLNFDIDVKFPDRNSQDIFNLYINRNEQEETESDISIDSISSANQQKPAHEDSHFQLPSTSKPNQQAAKRKQSQLSPSDDTTQPKPHKTKKTSAEGSTKEPSQPHSAPPTPTKSSTPTKSKPIGQIRERVEYYIYKSESDKVSYDPLPTIEGITQLFLKQKFKIGLPRPHSKQELFQAIKDQNTEIYYPNPIVQSLKHNEFHSIDSIFSVKLNEH